jgi:hypothetical protein
VSTPRAGSVATTAAAQASRDFTRPGPASRRLCCENTIALQRHAAGVLSYDPKQNQIDVEMKAAGRMLGTTWLPDLSRRS